MSERNSLEKQVGYGVRVDGAFARSQRPDPETPDRERPHEKGPDDESVAQAAPATHEPPTASEVPAARDAREIPAVHEAPDTVGPPDVPEVQGVPDTVGPPDVPGAADTDDAPVPPDMSDAPESPAEPVLPPVDAAAASVAPRAHAGPHRSPVLEPQVAQRLRDDWQQVQYDFVDDPRQAAERADAVVVRATRRVAEALLARNAEVRGQWQALGPGSAAVDTGTSTEQLRVVLQQYRDVLNRVIDL
ncbi:hypothetical protein [Streptacidiphilus rugosus]|uniref:hypothetical protein n=1 Tax=Streptacidiphilus rugosus TaxID=405783 RepID=UPI000690A736|nr:hypothetical protein [Streptacidiphilus rugosus]